jgi:hypothetical protein
LVILRREAQLEVGSSSGGMSGRNEVIEAIKGEHAESCELLTVTSAAFLVLAALLAEDELLLLAELLFNKTENRGAGESWAANGGVGFRASEKDGVEPYNVAHTCASELLSVEHVIWRCLELVRARLEHSKAPARPRLHRRLLWLQLPLQRPLRLRRYCWSWRR